MNTYLALTIGPIYKTFQNVRKTREVWAASYLFSFIMKQIVVELKIIGIALDRFIVPFVNETAIEYKGVGIFPDRLIFQSHPGDYEKLQKAISDSITTFAVYYKDDYPDIGDYLDEYLRIYVIEKMLPDGANIIEEMFKHLDTLELQNFPLSDKNANCNNLFTIFNQINNKKEFFQNNNFQKSDPEYKDLGLADANGNIRFESVAEIATTEFKLSENNQIRKVYKELVNTYLWRNNADIDSDQAFIEALKEKFEEQDLFKPYHKYIAIIKADGDKIGSTIAGLNGNVEKLRNFSEGMLNWAFESDKVVRKYGGVPIYIGGDDLLIFAPIACNGKTILDLLDDIDTTFKVAMKGYDVSLSYGISITYYKYPMFEAIGKVDELLKKAKDFSKDRNAICIRVIKHSGSVFETIFRKGNLNTKALVQKLTSCISGLEEKKDKKEKSFLNSVGYYLRDNEDLLKLIGKYKDRLENFFSNNFDDYKREKELKGKDGTIKERNSKAKFLKQVEELVRHCFENEPDTGKVLPSVYSIIRISRFLKGQEDEK